MYPGAVLVPYSSLSSQALHLLIKISNVKLFPEIQISSSVHTALQNVLVQNFLLLITKLFSAIGSNTVNAKCIFEFLFENIPLKSTIFSAFYNFKQIVRYLVIKLLKYLRLNPNKNFH